MTLYRRIRLILACMALALPTAAFAQTKMIIATSSNPEVAALFVAKQEGMFAKHNIDATIQLIQLNPTLPASLLSDSIQVGAATPTVFTQAVDNGLDLVAIAGVSVVEPTMQSVSIVARTGSNITKAADFKGKTVSVPGLNAILHITFQMWLEQNGVDPKTVRYVENPLPVVGDILKSGTVDAAIGVDPFLTRLEQAGIATRVAPFLPLVAAGQQTMFYATTRAWATQHVDAVKAFRAAMQEAADFIKGNPDKTREDINAFMKLPPEAVKTLAMPLTKLDLDPKDISFWAETMRKFGLVSNKIDPEKVLFK
jgi:NitT/TauT family transport system substrate-binding protein